MVNEATPPASPERPEFSMAFRVVENPIGLKALSLLTGKPLATMIVTVEAVMYCEGPDGPGVYRTEWKVPFAGALTLSALLADVSKLADRGDADGGAAKVRMPSPSPN